MPVWPLPCGICVVRCLAQRRVNNRLMQHIGPAVAGFGHLAAIQCWATLSRGLISVHMHLQCMPQPLLVHGAPGMAGFITEFPCLRFPRNVAGPTSLENKLQKYMCWRNVACMLATTVSQTLLEGYRVWQSLAAHTHRLERIWVHTRV